MSLSSGYKYLIDTTPAVSIPIAMMKTRFFRDQCFFSEEIIHEIGNNKQKNHILPSNIIPVDAKVLSFLSTTVLTGLSNDTKLVDLYTNKGNGDVILIATILSERFKEVGQMFKTDWIIVTSDKGVVRAGLKYDIKCMSKDNFLEILARESESEKI